MLQARIGGLASEARRVVLSASIMGESFWRGSVAAVLVCGHDDDELDRGLKALQHGEIIQAVRDGQIAKEPEYLFRHALMRDAAYGLLHDEDRRLGHHRAAEFLESCGIIDSVVLSRHWQSAGSLERALPYFIQAAYQALSRSDAPGALAHAERGLACGASGVRLGELRAIQALSSIYLADFAAALPALNEALQVLPEDNKYWGIAAYSEIGASLLAGFFDSETTLIERFLSATPAPQAIPMYVNGVASVATVLGWYGQPGWFHRFFERAEAAARLAATDPTVISWLLWLRCWQKNLSGIAFPELLKCLNVASEAFESIADWRIVGFIRSLRAQTLAAFGDPVQAAEEFRAVQVLSQRHQEQFVFVWVSLLYIPLQVELDASECAQAESLGKMLLSANLPPLMQAWIQSGLAQVALCKGQLQEAEQKARVACSQLGAASAALQLQAEATLAESLLRQERYAEARTEAALALKSAPPNTSLSNLRTALRVTLAQAHAALGDKAAAQAMLAEALAHIEAHAQPLSSEQRHTFLHRVTANRRARELAKQYSLELSIL
jgi:tetratricopeptide (TPR) repeat protein